MRSRGISLANKCQLLFGAAIVLILTAALSVPWFRMHRVIDRGEQEIARQLANAWLQNVIELGTVPETGLFTDKVEYQDQPNDTNARGAGRRNTGNVGRFRMEILTPTEAAIRAEENSDSVLQKALNDFQEDPEAEAIFSVVRNPGQPVHYRYLRPISDAQLARVQDPRFAVFSDSMLNPSIANPLRAILVIGGDPLRASGQLFVKRTYIILSGFFAGALAVLVFYFITTRLILSPVRVLRETTDRVSRGDRVDRYPPVLMLCVYRHI